MPLPSGSHVGSSLHRKPARCGAMGEVHRASLFIVGSSHATPRDGSVGLDGSAEPVEDPSTEEEP